jgi:monofunctional biosynthetic peptidoglycan transglycosylase
LEGSFASKKRTGRNILWAVVFCTVSYIASQWITYPDIASLARENPHSTAWMRMREKESQAKGKKPRHYQIWVPLASISPNLKNAVLIAEDAAFFQHEGLDYHEIKEAIKINAEKMEFARGASTITQQLAKNLYLSPSKNPIRKLKELLLTFSLERNLSKKRIFEIYLNVIEWGDGIYGAEAASRTYFGKPSSDLTDGEAAALAAVIINPIRYSPVQPNKRMQHRIAIIEARMSKYSYYKN